MKTTIAIFLSCVLSYCLGVVHEHSFHKCPTCPLKRSFDQTISGATVHRVNGVAQTLSGFGYTNIVIQNLHPGRSQMDGETGTWQITAQR